MADGSGERRDRDVPDWAQPFAVVAAVAAVMWIVEIVDLFPNTRFDQWGIKPRQAEGLTGVVAAPFLHADLQHLVSNTIPFLILGGLIAFSGVARYVQVTVIVAVISAVGTWLIGPENTIHIGASGIVFGYITYLMARGFYGRNPLHLLVGVGVLVVYGGVLWGALPQEAERGISWQGHLFGAIGGVVAAYAIHADKDRQRDDADA